MFTKFLVSLNITLFQKTIWIIFKEIENFFLSETKEEEEEEEEEEENLISVQISVESRDL